jgi:hypothetical protein
MSKKDNWFKHEYGARNDDALLILGVKFGFEAKGLFWDIVERMYQNGDGSFDKNNLQKIADLNNTSLERIEYLFSELVNIGLFFEQDNLFYSKFVLNELNYFKYRKEEISEIRSVSGSLGGRPRKEENQKKGNESKTKQSKPNESKTFQDEANESEVKQKKLQTIHNKEEKEKINKKENFENAKIAFDSFRKKFGGSKRGLDVEFENFVKKTPDWEQVLPMLDTAIEQEIAYRQRQKQQGKFVPEWKNLQTWINGKFWTQEFETTQKPNEPTIPYRLTLADVDYDPSNTHIYGGDGFNIRGEDREGYNRQGKNEYGFTREEVAERSKAS